MSSAPSPRAPQGPEHLPAQAGLRADPVRDAERARAAVFARAEARSADDRALPAELRVLLTCLALVAAALLCRVTGLGEPRSLLLFVVLTIVACVGLPWRAAVLVGASAWAVHSGFVVGRLGVLVLSGPRLTELLLLLGVAGVSWLAGRLSP